MSTTERMKLFLDAPLEVVIGFFASTFAGVFLIGYGEYLAGLWAFVASAWAVDVMINARRRETFKKYVQACINERENLIHNEAERKDIDSEAKYALGVLAELEAEIDR